MEQTDIGLVILYLELLFWIGTLDWALAIRFCLLLLFLLLGTFSGNCSPSEVGLSCLRSFLDCRHLSHGGLTWSQWKEKIEARHSIYDLPAFWLGMRDLALQTPSLFSVTSSIF